MTTWFSATWLPAGIARKALLATSRVRPRAPQPERAGQAVLTEAVLTQPETPPSGPHAAPEWTRELFDPARDGDPLEWLGFAPEAD